MTHKLPTTTLLLMALFLAPTAVASTTWYVNGVSGNNSNTCTSPTTACKTIKHAISLAASGDSIIVCCCDLYRESNHRHQLNPHRLWCQHNERRRRHMEPWHPEN